MNNTAHIAYWKQIALLQAILQSKLESCLMFQFYQLFRLLLMGMEEMAPCLTVQLKWNIRIGSKSLCSIGLIILMTLFF